MRARASACACGRRSSTHARSSSACCRRRRPTSPGWTSRPPRCPPEVGGDYYDTFRLTPTRLVLVVADVSGHGLASGLLLSGVRSCLYLLEDDLASPDRKSVV